MEVNLDGNQFDDRLLQTLKSDISGVIGRVAR